MPTTSDRLKAAFTHRYAVERELGSGGMATEEDFGDLAISVVLTK